jgi:Zn2+/Cd2+-exporting ATPase
LNEQYFQDKNMANDAAEKLTFSVTGMDCGGCAAKVRGAIERMLGVSDVDVAVMGERMLLMLQPGSTTTDKIADTVNRLGFQAALKPPKNTGAVTTADDHSSHKDHDNSRVRT